MFQWLSPPRAIAPVEPGDYETLEEIHAASFRDHWSADEQAAMAGGPGVATFVARRVAATSSRRPVGFITVRIAGDEGEVLTMAVHPRQRRSGLGRMLLNAALRHFYAERVSEVFLEVDPDNAPALALYRRAGFAAVGERPEYYAGEGGARTRALTMRLDLSGPEATP